MKLFQLSHLVSSRHRYFLASSATFGAVFLLHTSYVRALLVNNLACSMCSNMFV